MVKVFYNCAAIVALNFLWLFFYDDPSKDLKKTDETAFEVFCNHSRLIRPRLLFFCLAFSGFWAMFQLSIFCQTSFMMGRFVNVVFAGKVSLKAVPTIVSVSLSPIFGSIFGLIAFLSLRL